MRRVLLDQGLPATAAGALRQDGWDAVHTSEIGMQVAEDSDILRHALTEARTVITLDRDFPQLLALTAAERPSVILIRQQRLRSEDLTSLLERLWLEYSAAIQQACVLMTGPNGTRVRLLPLRPVPSPFQ